MGFPVVNARWKSTHHEPFPDVTAEPRIGTVRDGPDVPSRQPRRVRVCEVHAYLGSGIARTDDEHTTVLQLLGVAVAIECSWSMSSASSFAKSGTFGTW